MTTAAMPPVGPLTSTENLLPGDILRVVRPCGAGSSGTVQTLISVSPCGEFVRTTDPVNGHLFDGFAFVARPGVWMPWAGGTNPVPGMKVRVRGITGSNESHDAEQSEELNWSANFGGIPIREYMVVADAEQPRKGDPVEPPFGCQPLPQGVSDRVMDAAMVDAGMMDHRDYVKAHGGTSAQPEQKVIHFDPFTGKDGDHVRVSFSATLGSGPSENGVVTSAILSNLKNKYPDLVIELLERPLSVGDDVLIMGGSRGKIVGFLSDGRAVCEYDAGDMTNVVARNPSCLTRA